ncbi:hypothetical protein L4X63_22440 [Geomonas sp. Red32]|uniref:hypothetical protein n=1 Tax=Geomonas sp. Red32 TaxID=2912856 RepID=UPI00202CC63B|nr:hypothetical protein [Geomonas sp. Red32]MCM0084348.1 hypothetical protein [Geomonas sp. Red32]
MAVSEADHGGHANKVNQVNEVNEELRALKARLAQLESSMAGAGPPPAAEAPPEPQTKNILLEEPEEISEEILNWAERTHLLTRLSTLCFLLVVALILRTLTDNNLINTLLGSGIGMTYAAFLMIWGGYGYEKKSALAPVFACCGAALMSTIVVETHARFASLPLIPAYLTLICTGGWMTFVSYRHRAFLPISVGTLGMCLAGAAIDYPHPFFPYLAMILFAANILGYFAARLKSCSWLRWIVLAVTIAMLQLWAVRLGIAVGGQETPAPELAPAWFLPTLAAFCLLFLSLAWAGILRSSGERISRFDFALPTVNVVWGFLAAYYVVKASGGSLMLLGTIGLLIAGGHLWVTFWLTERKVEGAPGTNSFAFAGAALAAAALPALLGKFLIALPALAVVSVFMSFLSREWKNGGIRLTSYVVQIYASLALAMAMLMNPRAASDVVATIPAGLLTLITLYQYQWCRRYPPPSPSVFSRYDRLDRSAVLLLLAALLNGFFMVKVAMWQVMSLSMPARDVANALRCATSVAINGSAAAIMVLAYFRSNKEWRNVAILVTLIGGAKVFVHDLLGAHGVPLVASVFSFGLAAAIESLALGKWKKGGELPEGTPPPQE